jgi:hypothetical protein
MRHRDKKNVLSRLSPLLRLVVFIVLTISVPAVASAEWSAIAEQKTSYTTDALQFSSARRLRFTEDPSQPTGIPLGNPQDVIWEPSLEVLRSSSNHWGGNELSVKARGYIFTSNPIFNHGDYRIQDRQWLDEDTSILLRYRYVPNLFLGPNFERRTGTRSIQEERLTSHHWRAEFERRVGKDTTITLVGRYGLRLYNEAFAERDTNFYTVGPHFRQQLSSWLSVTLSYLYERGLADGRHEVQFNDDVSYFLHLISCGADLSLARNLTLELSYIYVRKTFTSNLVGDTHYDRRDQTHQGLAELRYQFTPKLIGTLGFQRTQRSSTNALRDFNDSIVSMGAEYHF